MNRKSLIHTVAEECDEPLGIVEQIISATLRTIVEEIGHGSPVEIEGFGKFCLRFSRPPRSRDPKTGVMVEHPAYHQIAFKAAGAWRSQVNGGRGKPSATPLDRAGFPERAEHADA